MQQYLSNVPDLVAQGYATGPALLSAAYEGFDPQWYWIIPLTENSSATEERVAGLLVYNIEHTQNIPRANIVHLTTLTDSVEFNTKVVDASVKFLETTENAIQEVRVQILYS
ncbi:MAG: hypothetical protein V2I33_22465 [Kangiellaceae bacterium]|jgi:hypothetical protein|nr:hypothetical protein [Kangiellaceae bacterium]